MPFVNDGVHDQTIIFTVAGSAFRTVQDVPPFFQQSIQGKCTEQCRDSEWYKAVENGVDEYKKFKGVVLTDFTLDLNANTDRASVIGYSVLA